MFLLPPVSVVGVQVRRMHRYLSIFEKKAGCRGKAENVTEKVKNNLLFPLFAGLVMRRNSQKDRCRNGLPCSIKHSFDILKLLAHNIYSEVLHFFTKKVAKIIMKET